MLIQYEAAMHQIQPNTSKYNKDFKHCRKAIHKLIKAIQLPWFRPLLIELAFLQRKLKLMGSSNPPQIPGSEQVVRY